MFIRQLKYESKYTWEKVDNDVEIISYVVNLWE